ncbi:MAG: hypothetical protein ACO1N0_01760 [Fluviicola sp.]|jgi:hypothetical protein
MQLEKKDINIFLMLWIKNDPDLWGELRDIQIKILLDRIVKEKSYAELAKENGTDEFVMKKIFEAILTKIDKLISADVARHLRTINRKLDARPDKPFDVIEVYLN